MSMMNKSKTQAFSQLSSDVPAGIVVFLVAVPLCLGIALASGAPLFSGIISGMIGGIVVTLFSKSPLGVSGPAAGLAVIVLTSIQELGNFEAFLLAVVIAGLFQIIFGVLKAGVIGYYFPSAVIKGMLTGIGIIIILKQLPHAFGYDSDPEGDFEFFQIDGHNTFSELIYMTNYISPGAFVVALLSLLVLIIWERPFVKRFAVFKVIQGPLVVVILGIVLNFLFNRTTFFEIQSIHMVSVPVSGNIQQFFSQFTLPDFSQWQNAQIYVVAFTIAVVASLETLLCVEATDKLDPQKRVTPTNRELLAQGLGNMLSGLIGGLPVTQVIVRSSANIQSGGKTKMAAFVHGILLFISALAIPKVLNMIPLASLAAILLVVGYKLAKPSLFKEMWAKGHAQFIPFAVTVFGIVFTDLLIGIGLGMIVGIFQILWNNYKSPYHFDYHDYVEGQPVKISLSEDVSFLNKASILQTLNHMPDGAHVIIDASRAKNVHPDVEEIIEDFAVNAKIRHIVVELIGLSSDTLVHPMEKLKKTVQGKRP
jgi:MFS superfamily sulfate permease-like transporter